MYTLQVRTVNNSSHLNEIFGLCVYHSMLLVLFVLVLSFDLTYSYPTELSSIITPHPSDLFIGLPPMKRKFTSQFSGVCCRCCHLLCISGSDMYYENWSALMHFVRYIMSMWYGPSIDVKVTSTLVPRKVGNTMTMTICSTQAFSSARKKMWTNFYHLSKKADIWNGVVEKVSMDYEGSRKEFWAFVGRRSKGKKKTRGSLRSDKGVSVTSTRGKLHVLQKHYKDLGRMSEDSDFDS